MGSRMDQKVLEFLVKSRQNTYAAGIRPEIINSGKTYIIKEGNLEYRDTYFDQHLYFQGQELVFRNNEPIWSMSYRGAATDDSNPDQVFEALQKFIKEYADKVRFGENIEAQENEFQYKCNASGDINEFKGREEIYQKGKLAHWLDYFGGEIR